MSERPDRLLLEDILEAMNSVEEYVAGFTHEMFLGDKKTQDAVTRNLEIIGEAANRLSAQFKAAHSGIEWGKMVGLRHRIVHEYFGVDIDIIWRIVKQDVPSLRKVLAGIVEK